MSKTTGVPTQSVTKNPVKKIRKLVKKPIVKDKPVAIDKSLSESNTTVENVTTKKSVSNKKSNVVENTDTKKNDVSHRKINNKPVLSALAGINISPAKVKNIISNFILNKDMHAAYTEIKNAEPRKITKVVDGKTVEEDFEGTPLNALSKSTLDYIEYANKIYDSNKRFIYTKNKVSKLSPDQRKLYNDQKNTAKLSKDAFDLDKFNVSFDPDFYSDYDSAVGSNKKTENKTEWRLALDNISKLKSRFSTNSRIILSALTECLIKQLVLNGTFSCVADNKKIIQLSHVLDTSKDGFNERFPLYPFITNLKSFKKASSYIKSLDTEGKGLTIDFSIEGLPIESQHQFKYYIGEICRDVRMQLCDSSTVDEETKSKYNYTSVSKDLKNFCSTIACEFLMKIGAMLKKEIDTRQIKTVNDIIINTVISHYHIVCDVDETQTYKFIDNVINKFNSFTKEKREKKKKNNSNKNDS